MPREAETYCHAVSCKALVVVALRTSSWSSAFRAARGKHSDRLRPGRALVDRSRTIINTYPIFEPFARQIARPDSVLVWKEVGDLLPCLIASRIVLRVAHGLRQAQTDKPLLPKQNQPQ